MNDAFLDWWKQTGQYQCCLEDYGSPEEYKRILWAAWYAGFRYHDVITRREPQSEQQ